MKKGIHMSQEPPVYKEGETVPVPDKGAWIDGELGQLIPASTDVVEPTKKPAEPPAPSVPRKKAD